MAAEVENKKETPLKGCPMKCRCYKKALQRRGTRVSEMFAEHRSSDASRPERSEWSVWPFLLPQAAALQKPAGLFAGRLRP